MEIKSIGKGLYVWLVKLFSGSGLYRFPLVRRANKKLLRLIKSERVKVNGITLFLDKHDSLNLSVSPAYEPEETEFVKRTVKSGSYAIDIGANIGYYTTLLARLVGPQGKVFSFEPDADNYRVLERNVKENQLEQVVLIMAAVSDNSGTVQMYFSGDKGDQRIYDSSDGRSSVSVRCVSLDEHFRDSNHPIDFIKIDVQGAEGSVVAGMRELLKRNPGVIVNLEFWPAGLEKSGFGARKFLDLLDSIGMCYYDIHHPDLTDQHREELLAQYTTGSKHFTNLICSFPKGNEKISSRS